MLERRVRGNSHARCEGGEKPETSVTVGLPIPIPYTHVCDDTAKVERFGVYGVFKRKKLLDDIRQARELEVQIWEQAFLVQRLLC